MPKEVEVPYEERPYVVRRETYRRFLQIPLRFDTHNLLAALVMELQEQVKGQESYDKVAHLVRVIDALAPLVHF